MTDADPFPNGDGVVWVGVQCTVVLDVAALSDGDGCVVGAQDGVIPHAAVFHQLYLTDQSGTLSDAGGGGKLRRFSVGRIKHKVGSFL